MYHHAFFSILALIEEVTLLCFLYASMVVLQIQYEAVESCQLYSITEGCAGDDTCGGTIVVTGGRPGPTVPTSPPTVGPTPAPTLASTFSCLPYAETETKDDSQGYSTCR